jgi:hypothetical protein
MKTMVNVAFVAVLLAATSGKCHALWEIATVSKEQAKELGMQFRSTAVGPNHVQVELQFKAEGELKNFSHAELRFGKRTASAPLREDRSKPGHFAVRFTVDRNELGNLNLWVMVRGLDGGTIYDLRVKELVESKGNR